MAEAVKPKYGGKISAVTPYGVCFSALSCLRLFFWRNHTHLCLRFDFSFFCFMFFQRLRVVQKASTSVHRYTPSPTTFIAKTTSHPHPQKQSFSLRHNKAFACIRPARSCLLLRLMASRAREGCQPVRQTVLFLVLLQKMGPSGTFLVASRKHRPYTRSLQAPTVPASASFS